MDIEIWGFDHGVVHVLAVPGSVMGLVGSLFLTFWDKVFVSSSRAHQDMKSVIGEGTAGNVCAVRSVSESKVCCSEAR